MDIRETRTLDIRNADNIEVVISSDGHKLWINVEGMCLFRAYNVSNIVVEDYRPLEGNQ